jgi:hypothetical protein
MYSKQQILHAIINDGQKMMKDGEVENRKEFQKYQNKNKKIFSPFFFVVAKFECTKKKML